MLWRGTAVITGASSGIGEQFAKALAQRGVRVVAVARRCDQLDRVVHSLAGAQLDHRAVAADLSSPEGTAALLHHLRSQKITVDILINNAGFGTFGHFAEIDPHRLQREINLNIGAVVTLTRALLPDMIRQQRGTIINVASTAAFQPVPHMAVYGATKAFVLSFTEALWGEVDGNGVTVLALCPGATATGFEAAAGGTSSVTNHQTPDDVVHTALHAIQRRKMTVVSGRLNTLAALSSRFLPRKTAVRAVRRFTTP